jgi:argininosuccinate synthase
LSKRRIVLAYSGSPWASAAIAWMTETWNAEVVTLTLDVGQGDELDAVHERAIDCGAARAHVLDVREAFAHEYLLPAFRAGAAWDGDRPLGRLLTRPLIAKQLVDVAKMEAATEVAHAARRDPADARRVSQAVASLDPALAVRAPLIDWNPSLDVLEHFAEDRGLRLTFAVPDADSNVWEARARAILETSGKTPDGVMPYRRTNAPSTWPESPALIEIEFQRGTPVGVNGVTMPLLEIISSLETIAGAHGVGRSQAILRQPGRAPAADDRTLGQADLVARGDTVIVCEVCETPAGAVLEAARQQLEQVALPESFQEPAALVRAQTRALVDRGRWTGLTRAALDAFFAAAQERVSGSVTLKLFKGTIAVAGCRLSEQTVAGRRLPVLK